MSLLKKMPLSKDAHDKIRAEVDACKTTLEILSEDTALQNARNYRMQSILMTSFADWRDGGRYGNAGGGGGVK